MGRDGAGNELGARRNFENKRKRRARGRAKLGSSVGARPNFRLSQFEKSSNPNKQQTVPQSKPETRVEQLRRSNVSNLVPTANATRPLERERKKVGVASKNRDEVRATYARHIVYIPFKFWVSMRQSSFRRTFRTFELCNNDTKPFARRRKECKMNTRERRNVGDHFCNVSFLITIGGSGHVSSEKRPVSKSHFAKGQPSNETRRRRRLSLRLNI